MSVLKTWVWLEKIRGKESQQEIMFAIFCAAKLLYPHQLTNLTGEAALGLAPTASQAVCLARPGSTVLGPLRMDGAEHCCCCCCHFKPKCLLQELLPWSLVAWVTTQRHFWPCVLGPLRHEMQLDLLCNGEEHSMKTSWVTSDKEETGREHKFVRSPLLSQGLPVFSLKMSCGAKKLACLKTLLRSPVWGSSPLLTTLVLPTLSFSGTARWIKYFLRRPG